MKHLCNITLELVNEFQYNLSSLHAVFIINQMESMLACATIYFTLGGGIRLLVQ